jgi:hypothetical protein
MFTRRQSGAAILAGAALAGWLALAAFGPARAGADGLGEDIPPGPEERRALARLGPKVEGEIVFASRRDGRWRLYRMDADGSRLAPLSPAGATYRWPTFVQQGSKLVFHSDRAGPMQIYLAEPDLSGARRLSPPGREERFHGMTADGRLMLVAKEQDPQGYVLREPATGRETPVDFSAHGLKQGWLGAYLSPDGRRLAYLFKASGPSGQPGRAVYMMDLDPQTGKAGNPREVSDGCYSVWSRDSRRILTARFAVFRGLPGTEIWSAGPQGPGRQLSDQWGWNYFPAWGPEEKWLAWASSPLTQKDDRTGNYEIYVKPLEGGEAVRLTFHSAPDVSPTWRAQTSPPPQGDRVELQAEAFAHPPGRVVEEGSAGGGRVVLAPASAGRGGHVVFGQRLDLEPGSYQAWFRLRAGEALGDGTLAELDVVAGGGARRLAKRPVAVAGLAGGGWEEVGLAFSTSRRLENLELRVEFHPGRADLLIDRIRLERKDPGR